MKKAFFLLLFLLSFSWLASAQEYCQLRGSVYIESSPKRASYRVYVEENEAFADMRVYKEENKLYADRPGIWYFTEEADFAQFRIYLVDDPDLADFTIFYTETESFAGCR
ncbi:DUF6150 family protein [Cytophagales bacterium LB-30]|uniref:DUF6150 family protein n=1 Tax=Shiella aurantiaca TaxID=3058365 RepID=A0ABT8F5H0_9BACT|nr:DUF6150 family protein [Shiella aurantiaca]MDN4165677.1 DUF6150 family protein [Shiella aurantiaca]